ncbi:MAG: HAMP domain-containing sensor histidine kinase [Candidatus Latescibacterota bacterium]|nr:HAMP domain-containing sensor histidine kinase [Candidatus Latescibacterota bacterium]
MEKKVVKERSKVLNNSRRRRRGQAPIDVVKPNVTDAHRKGHIWLRNVLFSLGISPIFRAYVFLGSVLAIIAFLLYNESLSHQLREQEKSRVGLYARLISFAPLASEEQTMTIFTEVINNPNIDFPCIITNHRGEIIEQRGIDDLLAREKDGISGWFSSFQNAQNETNDVVLGRLLKKMDQENEPIQYYLSPDTQAQIYVDRNRVVITDNNGDIVRWTGAGLPEETNQSTSALIQVRLALEELRVNRRNPLIVSVPSEGFSYLYFNNSRAIVTDGEGEIVGWRGLGLPDERIQDEYSVNRVRTFLQRLSRDTDPIPFSVPAEYYIHYGPSDLVSRISLAPFVQISVLLLFLLVGYLGYRNIKRSEQRSIWVGMAKETAHQLGTPLSSLSGWLELMRIELDKTNNAENGVPIQNIRQMVDEMDEDMDHLNQIALRFSQIGSVPELVAQDVYSVLNKTIEYFRHRGPQFGRHEIEIQPQNQHLSVPLNAELISWAFENLFKNSIDAMEGTPGHILINISQVHEEHSVHISFQDTGRGITPENIKRIFDPGFSTKKRGWGLGLAFVRRIVEEYHGGHISVVQSVPGEGTTFEVILPTSRSNGK